LLTCPNMSSLGLHIGPHQARDSEETDEDAQNVRNTVANPKDEPRQRQEGWNRKTVQKLLEPSPRRENELISFSLKLIFDLLHWIDAEREIRHASSRIPRKHIHKSNIANLHGIMQEGILLKFNSVTSIKL